MVEQDITARRAASQGVGWFRSPGGRTEELGLVLSSTDLELRLALRNVPYEYAYDTDSGEVTAFNDELRIMAIGSTPDEAEARFQIALVHWLIAELRAGNALPVFLREALSREPEAPRRPPKRPDPNLVPA